MCHRRVISGRSNPRVTMVAEARWSWHTQINMENWLDCRASRTFKSCGSDCKFISIDMHAAHGTSPHKHTYDSVFLSSTQVCGNEISIPFANGNMGEACHHISHSHFKHLRMKDHPTHVQKLRGALPWSGALCKIRCEHVDGKWVKGQHHSVGYICNLCMFCWCG